MACPDASTWGEGGHLKVWLNEKNAWLYSPLRLAQDRMTGLVAPRLPTDEVTLRALRQASRELMLAQASDWPFILSTETSPSYARQRFTEHLASFHALAEQISTGVIDHQALRQTEDRNNLFPNLDWRYWT
jgi:1,4-alpha-glucan branching enzyme